MATVIEKRFHVYLGKSLVRCEYNTEKELAELFKKHDIVIDDISMLVLADGVKIGNKVIFNNGKPIKDRILLDIGTFIGLGTEIGEGFQSRDSTVYDYVKIGNNCTINDVTLFNNVKIGNRVRIDLDVRINPKTVIGNDVIISNKVKIDPYCKIGNRVKLKPRCVIHTKSIIDDDVTIPIRCEITESMDVVTKINPKVITLHGLYKYTVKGMVVNGVTYIKMGCYIRSVKLWDTDFWNNKKEFKKDTPEGRERLEAYGIIKNIMFKDTLYKKMIDKILEARSEIISASNKKLKGIL